MNYSNILSKKALYTLLVFSIFTVFSLAPLGSVQAQSIFDTTNNTGTINTGNQNVIIQNPTNSSFVAPDIVKATAASPSTKTGAGSSDSQADAYENGPSGGGTSGGGSTASDALGCSASSLLGQALGAGIKSMVARTISKAAGALKNVPIIANATGDNLDIAKNASQAIADVNAVQQINGVPIGASFNGIAYCIVNSIIQYVANSTIAWAKSGFNGNPAFIQNPEGFFQTIADQQANQFISGIAYGPNICSNFRSDLGVALSQSYGAQANTTTGAQLQLSCSMAGGGNGISYGGSAVGVVPAPGNGPQVGGVSSGGSSGPSGFWSGWNATRLNENNLAGAFIQATNMMSTQIQKKVNTTQTEVNNNGGWLNFKKCTDNAAAKKGDTRTCKTVTPGNLIKSALDATLAIPKQRLVSAQKMDQIITQITNMLIKKALNTVLDQAN